MFGEDTERVREGILEETVSIRVLKVRRSLTQKMEKTSSPGKKKVHYALLHAGSCTGSWEGHRPVSTLQELK